MVIEHLLSTRNFEGSALLERMNVSSDVLVINQVQTTPSRAFEEFSFRGYAVRVFNYNERGIGISRKRALEHARGDILLICDDDMCYVSGYKDKIVHAYESKPDADIIFFKVEREHNDSRPQAHQAQGIHHVKFYNALRYGAVNISLTRKAVTNYNLGFDERFGDSLFKSGEDSVFIMDAYHKGAHLYSSSDCVATVDLSESSWFTDYNAEYLQNRGAIFYRISKRNYKLLCAQFALRRKNLFSDDYTFCSMMRHMEQGKQVFKRTYERKL